MSASQRRACLPFPLLYLVLSVVLLLPPPLPGVHAALKGVAIPFDYGAAVLQQPPTVYNCNDITLLNVTWTYNWYATEYCAAHPPANATISTAAAAAWPEYVPMIWAESQINNTRQLTNGSRGGEWLLGFNEPNFADQGVTTPERAAQLWPILEATDRRLVSPAPATCLPPSAGCLSSAFDWLDGFFGNCTSLYGAKGCRVDAIGIHFYPCAVNDTISGVEATYARYKRPLWITELACGGAGDPAVKQRQNEAFLPPMLTALDALHYVQRYAWVAVRLAVGDYAYGGVCYTGSVKENNMTIVGHLLRNHTTQTIERRQTLATE